jgi:signal transduction histidine kinase
MFGLGVFVMIKDPKRPANQTLFLALVAVTTFTVSHVIGVNVADPHLSRMILMFNLCNLFMSVFFAHCVFIVMDKYEEQRFVLYALYTLAIGLLVFYLIFPSTFLLDSVPKLYFPNYYVPGKWEWIMRVMFNGVVPAYFLFHMFRTYRTANPVLKNRLKYLFVGLFLGYSFGSLAIPLVYNFPVDPAWSSFFGFFFAIPFTYGVVKYDLLDIQVVAKQAFFYSLRVILSFIVIIGLIASNDYVRTYLPSFSRWVIPFFSSLIAVSIGLYVWKKLRETDVLKYQFIKVISHKFQTPLTKMQYVLKNLAAHATPDTLVDIEELVHTTTSLVELTSFLSRLSESDASNDQYSFQPTDINKVVEGIIMSDFAELALLKKIRLTYSGASMLTLSIDEPKIKLAIGILVENALNYTGENGIVHVGLTQDQKGATIKVSDNGIGLTKRDTENIFNVFYRGSRAREIDIDGVGVGLSMARRIIEKHGGLLEVSSAGIGKGSVFSFTLPA